MQPDQTLSAAMAHRRLAARRGLLATALAVVAIFGNIVGIELLHNLALLAAAATGIASAYRWGRYDTLREMIERD